MTRSADVVEVALRASRADGAVVLVEEVDRANIRWAANTVTTNGISRGGRVTVISTVDGGVAAVTRSGVDPGTVEDLVRASEAAARSAGPAPDAQPLIGGDVCPQWSEAAVGTSIDVFAPVVPALAGAFDHAAATGVRLYGYAEHEVRTTWLGTSAGLRRRHAQPTGSFSVTAKSADLDRSAYVGRATADFRDIDAAALAAEAGTRLDWARRRCELPPGRYETLLPPDAVADLVTYGHFAAGNARDVLDGRSAFSRPGGGTRLGEQLCGDGVRVSLTSDPAAPGLTCAPFVMVAAGTDHESVFDDGLALGPTEWIRDGVLTSLITTRQTAARGGLPVTPPIDNLTLSGPGASTATLAAMVASTRRGLLLTCLSYLRPVDERTVLLTGLTRDGVYLVEDGEVVAAVNNFRFNESPIDLLRRISEAGATVRCLGREFGEDFNRTAMPPLRIADFTLSSVSTAA